MAKEKAGEKGKKQKAKKRKKLLYKLFLEGKPRACPKCGPAVFLAKHKNRLVCGKCQYSEYLGKSSD